MNYRLQDIMKMIIPGLYLMAMILVLEISQSDFVIDTSKLKDVSAIVVLLIPFVGFVVGYFVECITAGLEHGWYALGGRRPSKNILSGSAKYPVADIDIVKKKHQISKRSITNYKANEVLQAAKQILLNKEHMEPYRNNAMLARNIFGAQLVFTVVYAVSLDSFYKETMWYISLGVSIAFLIYWIHHNHVYVKYVFAEYAKTLLDQPAQ